MKLLFTSTLVLLTALQQVFADQGLPRLSFRFAPNSHRFFLLPTLGDSEAVCITPWGTAIAGWGTDGADVRRPWVWFFERDAGAAKYSYGFLHMGTFEHLSRGGTAWGIVSLADS